MINFISLGISKIRLSRREDFREKDLPAKQPPAEENTWLSRKDEHERRAQCSEEKENEGKKEIDRLDPKFLSPA